MLPLPWHGGRVVVLGDAAHATTPQLAAGAAICLRDAVRARRGAGAAATTSPPASRASAAPPPALPLRTSTPPCIAHWQTHPDEPGRPARGVTAEAMQVLAEPC